MKKSSATAALLILIAGVASAEAAPRHDRGVFGKSHGVSKVYHQRKGVRGFVQKRRIALSRKRLANLKRRARADGRVTPYERRQIRAARLRLNALILRSRRF